MLIRILLQSTYLHALHVWEFITFPPLMFQLNADNNENVNRASSLFRPGYLRASSVTL